MKKFLLILVAVFTMEFAQANSYFGGIFTAGDIFKPARPISQIGKEDHVVFPFGLEIPFPWNITQGIWLLKGDKFESYFVLTVVKTSLNPKPRLLIQQYDINTCNLLAAGAAINQTDNGKVLWATMKTTPQFAPYRVGIRAFRLNSFSKDAKVPSIDGQVLVLTLESLSTSNKVEVHMAGQKLDNSVDMKAYSRCGRYRIW